jgi:hypothetical protein
MITKENSMPVTKAIATADVAAGTTAGIAGWTWLTPLTELAQLGATAVAIVTGIYAIVWHRARLAELKRKQNEQSNR